jgi:hypothetical protein
LCDYGNDNDNVVCGFADQSAGASAFRIPDPAYPIPRTRSRVPNTPLGNTPAPSEDATMLGILAAIGERAAGVTVFWLRVVLLAVVQTWQLLVAAPTLTLAGSLALIALAIIVQRRVWGKQPPARQLLSIVAAAGVAVGGAACLIFVCFLLSAPLQLYETERRKKENLVEDVRRLQAARNRAREQLETRQSQRAIRERLAAFVDEGEALKLRCLNADAPAPVAQVNDWTKRVEDVLRQQLGSAYVTTFRSAHATMAPPKRIPETHRNLWNAIDQRTQNLKAMLVELAN